MKIMASGPITSWERDEETVETVSDFIFFGSKITAVTTRLLCPWDFLGKDTGVGCHFLLQCMNVKSQSEVAQSCPTLCDPIDGSPPGSPVPGILQARTLEWVAISFSNA